MVMHSNSASADVRQTVRDKARRELVEQNLETTARVAEHTHKMMLRAQAEKDHDLGFANVIYRSVVEQLDQFQAKLDPQSEIGAALASFGSNYVIRILGVSYVNPYVIIFKGETEDGTPAELIQHVNQLNFLLLALPKPVEIPEPRRMGFLEILNQSTTPIVSR